jgi:hypothetical protein
VNSHDQPIRPKDVLNVNLESDADSEREDPEEARRVIVKSVESRPRQEEVDEHNVNHIPFRSWCTHCVKGKASNQGHSSSASGGHESDVPVVSIDYAFINEDGEDRKRRKEREKRGEEREEGEGRGMPMIVIHDSKSKYVAAEIVPEKGVSEYAVRRVAQIGNRRGYRRVIIKSDQEASIVALKGAVKRELELEVSFEESPVGEHQSNGAVENAIKRVQGQIRTVRDALESRIGERVKGGDNVFTWLVRNAAASMNRYQVGSDGRTAHERLRGRRFRRDVAEFGESVLYIRAESVGKDKYNSRWEEGVFLGVREESGEIIVGTKEGVIKARAFRKKGSEKERWSNESVKSVGGIPWEPIPGREGIEIKSSVNLPRDESEIRKTEARVEREVVRRRMKIVKEDITTIRDDCGV